MSKSQIAAIRQEFHLVTRFVPTTFLERGGATPFTTPQLAGARARPGERSSLEVIVPNPSGGQGVYILPWGSIDSLCNPTLHDRRLNEAVLLLRGVTPEAIRHTARDVAAEGLAGRGAQAAARRAREAESRACLQANFDLLLEVVRQVELEGENPVPPEQDSPAALEWRAKRAVARLAPRLKCLPETVVLMLEQLAACFGSIGVGRSARISIAVARLVRLRREVAEFAEQKPDDNGAEARLIVSTADLTIQMAKATLADAQELPRDIVRLLQRWAADPDGLLRLVARSDWLLDGWDRICALWELAPALGRTIAELVVLVPVVPREAYEWISQPVRIASQMPAHRGKTIVQQFEDWRTGETVCDLIARNELLLEKIL